MTSLLASKATTAVMWTTTKVKVADNSLKVRTRHLYDVMSSRLSSCCSRKLSLRRSTDAALVVPSTPMTTSSACANDCCRCEWLKLVCTKAFLIIVNLLFLVSTKTTNDNCNAVRVGTGSPTYAHVGLVGIHLD